MRVEQNVAVYNVIYLEIWKTGILVSDIRLHFFLFKPLLGIQNNLQHASL